MNSYSIKLTTGVLMLLIVFALLVLVSCDSPRYTADQVIVIVQKYSPEKCFTGELDIHSGKLVNESYSDPSWEVKYVGNSIWEIRKKCHQRDTIFYFDEKTSVIR
jgi:hypothetical protein